MLCSETQKPLQKIPGRDMCGSSGTAAGKISCLPDFERLYQMLFTQYLDLYFLSSFAITIKPLFLYYC